MRKVALLAALLGAAAFSSTSIANAQGKNEDPAMTAGKNTAKFLHDATVPYSVTAKAAAAPKAKKHRKHKKR